MTGKLLSASIGPAQVIKRTSPLPSKVSPFKKWASTMMIRYPIETNATNEVYFKESSRLRKESGIITSLGAI